ncbi:SusC/RagA family TonB-linked outer membrane protein [Sphingobacterium alkalisoli]|uniref:SusC/RagA family TonB-linked outer membrane protein n=1 Tax=Sphingobacterium alkalisoli TaxID=1874115 RepID=A0A4U0GZA9_9SPHI|nr:SusC/RagA family TonB-linked outer membrane protein [Sphingobacterium alkalisoli]TJY64597.1 SusC/RagA family TonB-linked outer membrane protein [Sphingobacterium alkalisoli]GGH20749.1 SusC/RagA family TonB-linked outer membrane protein [Sphingobacterium alkalisoli]
MKQHVFIKRLLATLLAVGLLGEKAGSTVWDNRQSSSQQQTVTGTVVDATDGIPIAGVTVSVRGTSIAVSSTDDGRYKVTGVKTDDVLVFSYIGYRTHQEPIAGRTIIPVQLGRLEDALEEVVVTALGIRREEKSLGYSVQRIGGEQVQQVKGVDIATSLTGKVAGLWIQNSTEFDESPDIRLRGGSSNPLLVIDGVPYGNMSLRQIAPDDIESIDVLKGATASALYGVRGGGGAIIVTTKSGGNGISVNSNNMAFAGYLALPEVQTSYSAGLGGSYNSVDYVWGNKLDIGIMEEQWNPETKQLEVMELTSRGKNNLKNFLEPGFVTNNNISFAQSGDIGSVRASLNHVYNKGQYPNLKLNRLNANVSGKLKVSEKFELQSNIGYNRSMTPQTTGAGYGDQGYIYQLLMWTGPEYDVTKFRDYWVVPHEQQNWHYKAWYDNPYLIAYEKLNGRENNMANLNLTSDYKPFAGAKITARVGYDFYSNENTRRNPPSIYSTRGWHANGMFGQYQSRGYSLNTDLLFNYGKKKLLNTIDIDLTAGGSVYRYEDQSLSGVTRSGLIVPGVYSLNNSVERPDVGTSRYGKQVNSLLGLASFGWKDAVFVDLTGRNDWSSTLDITTRSYFYPSVSSSVLLGEFFKLPNWMDMWKLRGSWTVSKQDLSVYGTNVNYSIGQGVWDGLNTADYPSQLNTAVIKPQTDRTWEAGTVVNILNNRLVLDAAYYNVFNYNRQLSSPIPASSGFTSTLINTNETRVRRGVELSLHAGVLKQSNFTWDATVNWATTHQYYKELDPVYSSDNLWTKAGGRVDNYTITDWLRDPQGNVVHTNGGLPQQGRYAYAVGYSDPKFIWGFTNSFTYRNFDLQLSFDGRVGGLLYNYSAYKMWDTGSHPDSDNQWRYDEVVNGNKSYVGNGVKVVSGSVSFDQYGRITEDTRVYAPNDVPVSYETYARRFADGRFGATDPTFIKIRELAIGYTVPRSLSERWGMSRARISLTAQNVFLWTKDFRFADPDWNADSDLTSPSQRFIGLNLNFHLAHADKSNK